MGVAKCVCCCRRTGRAGTSNRWRDSRCGCGHPARRLPSLRHPPSPRPGRPFPPEVTGSRVLWGLDARSVTVLSGAALSTRQVRHAGPDAFCVQRLQATSDRS